MSHGYTPNEVEVLQEYAGLKVETRKIEKRMDEIKGQVKDLLVREDAQDNPMFITGLGKLTLRPRKVWTWSDETNALEDSLKQAKEVEKATGAASFEEVQDVFFTDK